MILAVTSVAYFAVGLSRVRAARARRRWREVEAEVVSTDLDDTPEREFHIEYRYVVDGRAYTNDHIRPGVDAVSGPDAEELFRQYPVHRRTVVFFDPSDPAHSALEESSVELVLAPFLIGALSLALFGLWFWKGAGWP